MRKKIKWGLTIGEADGVEMGVWLGESGREMRDRCDLTVTQARSPSQSQVVQVQISTRRGRGRWRAQTGEGCIPETLLLPQLLLQTTDLPQVGLHQGPLRG